MPRHCLLSPEQLAAAAARVAAREPLWQVARDVGMKASALGYHVRGGKAAQYIGKPWVGPIREAHRLIGTGDYAAAAAKLTQAADHLRSAS